MKNTTETGPPLPTPDTAASTQSSPEPGPCLPEKPQETQASSSNCPPAAAGPEPAAPESISATTKAHLFIFDGESQEDNSQSIFGNNAAAPAEPPPTVNADCAFSLTQAQLEEDKQRIRELMEETNQVNTLLQKMLLFFYCFVIFVFGQQHPKEQQDEIFKIPLIFKVETLLSVLWACTCDGTMHCA